jgi:DNA-binding beta-propeller fold protein YncE
MSRIVATGSRLALVALLATACLSPVDPGDTEIAAVRVTVGVDGLATDTIQVRGTTRVRAAAIAREGYDVGVTDFTYESSDTAIAVVDERGTVRGIAPGTATITATRDGLAGEAEVVVVPSTIAYTIPVGSRPGAIAFSADYTRAYVTVGGDSLAIVQALDFYRVRTLGIGLPTGQVAATASRVYVTHPDVDSVSVLEAATGELAGRIWVGAGPDAVVASGTRAFVAARYDRKVVIVDGASANLGIPVGGEPTALALSRGGERLFATVRTEAGSRLVAIAPAYPDTIGSIALPAEPLAVATDGSGARVWVLVGGAAPRVLAFTVSDAGEIAAAGETAAGSGARGLAAAQGALSWIVASGDPALVTSGASLGDGEWLEGAGTGAVAIRPDGLFAFVLDPASGTVRVIAL